jgi:hypothetical protein
MNPRQLLATCAVLAVIAFVLDAERPRRALGVLGGAALAGLSYWGIRAGVDGLVAAATGTGGRARIGRSLVKFFTRHAILALAAYGMMARLHLDPIGMLIGVSALALAACVQSVRSGRTIPGR